VVGATVGVGAAVGAGVALLPQATSKTALTRSTVQTISIRVFMRINLHVRYDKNKRPTLDGKHWALALQCSDSLTLPSLPQFALKGKPCCLLPSVFIPSVP
jgi:hypothetical protein